MTRPSIKGFVRNVCKAARRDCRCDRCQRWFDPNEIVHTGYRDDGGVGVQFDDTHCWDCADELHESHCAKYLWKHASLKIRVKVVQDRNEDSFCAVSAFAARRSTAPVGYRFYTGEPEFY